MSDNSLNLSFFVRGDACFLLNQGDQKIAEVEFENGSFGFESGYVVGSDYGRYRVRNFAPKTFFKVYQLTQEESIYLPSSTSFKLNIYRCVMADGFKHKQCVLKSVERYGGYKPEAQFVKLPMEKVAQNSEENNTLR